MKQALARLHVATRRRPAARPGAVGGFNRGPQGHQASVARGEHQLRLRMAATRDAVPRLRHAAIQAVIQPGDPEELAQGVALVVTELAANVVRHAYPGRLGEIELEASRAAGHIHLIVRDWGAGFASTRDPGLGIGLKLVQGLATAIHTRRSGCTEVQARFPR
jgi:anti-sigma regulatory factor (Ser/Thr protein kinase)